MSSVISFFPNIKVEIKGSKLNVSEAVVKKREPRERFLKPRLRNVPFFLLRLRNVCEMPFIQLG